MEETYLKLLSISFAIMAGTFTVMIGMVGWYLKTLNAKVVTLEKVQQDVGAQHIQITTNYLTRFTNASNELNEMKREMIRLFEELRGVLNDHFSTRHAEVVEELEDLKVEFAGFVSKVNDNTNNFYKEFSSPLAWAKAQDEDSKRTKRGKKNELQ